MAISQFNDHLRRVVISGTIKEETAAVFLEQITALEFLDVSKPITIFVDTYGGSVDAALSIYDAMSVCSCPIRTIGVGKIMSAGVLILAAGDKGNRFITQNARAMIHQVSGGAAGAVKDMEITVAEISRQQDVFVELLAKHTGKTKNQIMLDINRDKYMSANEALNYGIIDGIVEPRKLKKKGK
jgi:ATP-dependent Clp protease protease subunit